MRKAMKKISASLLACAMLALPGAGTVFGAPEETRQFLAGDDFQEAQAGAFPAEAKSWTSGADATNIFVVREEEDVTPPDWSDWTSQGNQYLKLSAGVRGIACFVFRGTGCKLENPVPEADFTIQWDAYFEEGGAFQIVCGNNAKFGFVTAYQNGTYTINGTAGGQGQTVELPSGSWHRMAMAYDSGANTARIYIDGQDTGFDCAYVPNGAGDTIPNKLYFVVPDGQTGSMRIDNLAFYSGLGPVISTNPDPDPDPDPDPEPDPEPEPQPEIPAVSEGEIPAKTFTFDGESAAEDKTAWGVGGSTRVTAATPETDASYTGASEGSYLRVEGSGEKYTSGQVIDVTTAIPLASGGGPVRPDTDFALQFDVCFDTADATNIQMMTVLGDNFWRGMVLDYRMGRLQNETGNNATGPTVAIEPGTWHTVLLAYQAESNSARVSLDGADTGMELHSRSDKKPEQLFFGVNSAEAGRAMRVDNIKIYDRKFVYVGSSLPEGYANAPILDMKVSLRYATAAADSAAEAVTVTDSAGQQAAMEATVEKGRITVRSAGILTPGETYAVTVPAGILDVYGTPLAEATVWRFTTAKQTLAAGRPEIAETGDTVAVTARGKNLGPQPQSAVLWVGQYDAAGRMQKLTREIRAFAPGEEGKITLSLTPEADTAVIRAYITGEEGALLRDDFALLDLENQSGKPDRIFPASAAVGEELTVAAAQPEGNSTAISGTFGGAGLVLIQMRNPHGETMLTLPLWPEADGSYRCPYTFAEDAVSGAYTVTAQNAAGTDRAETLIQFMQSGDRAALLTLAGSKTPADLAALRELLEKNREVFGLESAQIACAAQTLREQGGYASYEEALAMIRTAAALLDKLNAKNWDGLSAFLQENHEIVLYGNPDYAAYAALSGGDKNLINKAVSPELPVADFVEFRELFSKKTAAFRAGELTQKQEIARQSGGASGSRGSFGGGMTVGFDQALAEAYAPEPGTAPQAGQEPEIFIDLDTSLWAKESILRLYDLGVISPAEDRRFRPEDSITREEMVKLLAAAFGLKAQGGDCGFTDADRGAWYQSYLTAAKEAGIIQGNPDGSFGVGQPVTRQDMAVMVYRTCQVLQRNLKQTNPAEAFTDSGEIADYAAEAVAAMQEAGIINGMGDGTFRPMEQSSRAQAAKMLAGLLSGAAEEG